MKPVVMAILGGTSHLAKSIIAHFCESKEFSPVAFVRSESRMREFSDTLSAPVEIREFSEFEHGQYDLIINCIGAGSPAKLGDNYSRWFTLTEEFDNCAIRYLQQVNSRALYVNFSSGGIYGKGHDSGMEENTLFSMPVNHVSVADYYSVVRLYTECKHRSLVGLNIVDIRIFSWFSRYADPDAGYFLTDIMKALKDGSVMKTSSVEIIRDYPSPRDLCQLIRLCVEKRTINFACDLYSVKPVGKFEILQSLQNAFGLQYEKDELGEYGSPNGLRNCYYSQYHVAEEIGYHPTLASLETIHEELELFLKREKNRL